MAVLHKKRNANTKKRARLMLGMAACVFAPTALAVWYLTALLAKRQPPAALAYGALAAAAAGAPDNNICSTMPATDTATPVRK